MPAQAQYRSSRLTRGDHAAAPPVTILVTDDEPSFVRALAALLRRDGHAVDTADNGSRALSQLEEHPYDVLLCDMRMPELDGSTFYNILSSQYPHLRQRVIFLTGDTGSEDTRTFLTQCGRPWLRKPSAITTIRHAIQQVLQAFPQA